MKPVRIYRLCAGVLLVLVEFVALGLIAGALTGQRTEGGIIAQVLAGLQVATQASSFLSVVVAVAAIAVVVLATIGRGASEPLDRESRASVPDTSGSHGAVQLLGFLQSEGRLVDFLEEDMSQYTDAQVGAAARAIHQGCRRVLSERVNLVPILAGDEGEEITVKPGFDPAAIRVTGSVCGEPPYKGVLRHAGWRATDLQLPTLLKQNDPTVIAPAEVEVI